MPLPFRLAASRTSRPRAGRCGRDHRCLAPHTHIRRLDPDHVGAIAAEIVVGDARIRPWRDQVAAHRIARRLPPGRTCPECNPARWLASFAAERFGMSERIVRDSQDSPERSRPSRIASPVDGIAFAARGIASPVDGIASPVDGIAFTARGLLRRRVGSLSPPVDCFGGLWDCFARRRPRQMPAGSPRRSRAAREMGLVTSSWVLGPADRGRARCSTARAGARG